MKEDCCPGPALALALRLVKPLSPVLGACPQHFRHHSSYILEWQYHSLVVCCRPWMAFQMERPLDSTRPLHLEQSAPVSPFVERLPQSSHRTSRLWSMPSVPRYMHGRADVS